MGLAGSRPPGRLTRRHAGEPDVAAQLERYAEAAAVLWELDLEPARAVLQACYAPSPHGGKPWDAVVLLRCLLLQVLVGQPSVNNWADDLAASRVLRVLAGLPEDRRPGVGTFYDFFHRLHDGPVRKTCEHQERPSELERRRARSPRTPSSRQTVAAEPAPPKRRKKGKRKDRKAIAAPVADPGATQKVVAELRSAASLANPNDLLERLGSILLTVAVRESALRGLLGDPGAIPVAGDGSPLRTGASRYGKKACDHPKNERCGCPRVFSDPDARMGWDSHRECYFFGHRFYEISTSVAGHDLPLAIRLDPANETDFTASIRTLDRLCKGLNGLAGTLGLRFFIADAGHDGEANYRFCLERGLTPVIPLKSAAPVTHPSRPSLTLSPRGVPTCQAGVEMTPWGTAGGNRNAFLCPVKAGRLERCPLAPLEQPDWTCRPDQRWGPIVTIKPDLNPRLCPPLPRNHPQFQELMNLRSGCERSNSVKKKLFKLEEARHRRASFWLIRLHLMALLQHGRTWAANLDRKGFIDHLLGRQSTQTAA